MIILITITANQYALNNLVYRPLRRWGVNTVNLGVYTQKGEHVGIYDPITNELNIAPNLWDTHIDPALKKALSQNTDDLQEVDQKDEEWRYQCSEQ